MALVQKRNTKRTIILVAVMVAIVIGGAVYYFLSSRTRSVDQSIDIIFQEGQIPTDFGVDLLRSPMVTGLRSFGHIPVSDDPGAGNPAPFGSQ